MVAELDFENAICLRPLNDQILKQRTAVQQLHPSCLVSQAVDEEDRGLEGILEPRIPVTEILTMTTKIRVPTFNSETDDYETYKSEIEFWKVIGKVTEKEQALLLVYELKKDDPSGIREKVLNEMEIKTLNAENGLEKYLEFMDKHFKKDESVSTYSAYLNFEKCVREEKESIAAFCMRFDKQSNIAKKKKVVYPPLVLAFKLLDNSGLSEVDRKLVLSEMILTNDDAYDSTKKALVKYKSESVCSKNSSDSTRQPPIKLETENSSVLLSEEQEQALMAQGWSRPRSFSSPWGRGRGGGGYRGGYQGGFNRNQTGRKNPKDRNTGEQLRCYVCDSTYHMRDKCPHKDEEKPVEDKRRNDRALVAEVVTLAEKAAGKNGAASLTYFVNDKPEDVILYSGDNQGDFALLCKESVNVGLLDTGCTSNVCGSEWLNTIKAQLDKLWKSTEAAGTKTFKFGGDEILKSERRVTFQCNIAGTDMEITTDVVSSSIPLLISMGTMQHLELLWDLKNAKARILGKWTNLLQTTVGHFGVRICPIMKKSSKVEETLVSSVEDVSSVEELERSIDDISNDDEENLEKNLKHIHRQFGHPTQENWNRFVRLCKDGVWTAMKKKVMDSIYKCCKICKLFERTPSRPVVKLPITCDFNRVVTVDLKEKKIGKYSYIFHIIDGFTRLACSVLICDKKAETIVAAFAMNWISVGYGKPAKLWSDVGGEFNNEHMKALGEAFGFEVSTGAGYSAWMNGLNERNHGVIDKTFEKIILDDPKMNPEVALAWAVNAKNCLPMNCGFSSFQLVFGKNPSLPGILSDKLPALEGVTTSKVVAEHITALHAGRKAFAEVQCDESIRRALRHRVRAAEKVFKPGNKVYYKRDGQDRWKGPAVVIGNDGSVYYLRHQGNLYRVAACRINDIEDSPVTEENSNDNKPNNTEEIRASAEEKQSSSIYISPEQTPPTPTTPDVPQPNVEIGSTENIEIPEHESTANLADQPIENPRSVRRSERRKGKTSYSVPKVGEKISYRVGEGENADWFDVEVFGKGKAGTRNESYLNLRYADGSEGGVFIDKHEWKRTEAENPQDEEVQIPTENEAVTEADEEVFVTLIPWSQHNLPECITAKEREMDGWKENNSYIEVKDEGQTTIPTMWVLNEKQVPSEKQSKEEKESVVQKRMTTGFHGPVKARLVARGNFEQLKVQSDSPAGGRDALHVALAIGASRGWIPKTSDVKNAFLQGKSINRDVYLMPPPDQRKPGIIWKVLKCVYGLDDAGRNWFLKVESDLKAMKCIQSKVDPCLFFYFPANGDLGGIIYLYVDDFLHLGGPIFEEEVVRKIHKVYKIGKMESGNFSYTGLKVHGTDDGIVVNQVDYISNLENVDFPGSFDAPILYYNRRESLHSGRLLDRPTGLQGGPGRMCALT